MRKAYGTYERLKSIDPDNKFLAVIEQRLNGG